MVEVKNRNDIFRCQICGNMTEVLFVGGGEMICCGEPMENLKEKSQDEGLEKHVPVIEDRGDGKYLVKVGSVEHPMEEAHFIQWIELIADGEVYERKFLSPGDQPSALFCLQGKPKNVWAREFCNLHGLWSSKKTIDS